MLPDASAVGLDKLVLTSEIDELGRLPVITTELSVEVATLSVAEVFVADAVSITVTEAAAASAAAVAPSSLLVGRGVGSWVPEKSSLAPATLAASPLAASVSNVVGLSEVAGTPVADGTGSAKIRSSAALASLARVSGFRSPVESSPLAR